MNYFPQTKVHLLSNVPFNFTYKDVRDFDSIQEQTDYFLSKRKGNDYSFESLTYQRVNANSIKLEIPYDDLQDVNYMMFQNDAIEGKWFYAFITDYTFISPNVTQIFYQLDVYQTFLFDFTFMKSYVEREHCQRFEEDGTPIFNTIDEGLAYGTDYKITNVVKYEQCQNVVWCVLIAKCQLERIPSSFTYGGSTLNNVQTPLYFYLIPISLIGETLLVNTHSVAPLTSIFSLFTTNPDFVGTIVSMYYTPFIPFDVSKSGSNITIQNGVSFVGIGGQDCLKVDNAYWGSSDVEIYQNMFSAFPSYTESKLYSYPYSLIEITNLKGETTTLKMSNFTPTISDKNKLILNIMSSISTSPKTAIYPSYYLNSTNIPYFDDFTCGIIDNTICDIPIIDDYTASYLQANRNSIALTNKYAMDNAKRGVVQNNQVNKWQNQMTSTEQKYMEFDANAQMIDSLLKMNIGSTFGSMNNLMRSYDLSEGQRAGYNLNNQIANENLMINAEQQIGLTNAKLEDINNIPPTISNLGNNALFDLGNKVNGVYVICKTIRDEYSERLETYFKMFGYKVNTLEIPNTKSRESFNYIKTIDAKINGNIPNNYLNVLKGIFDKGVTIWHTNDVGNYDVANSEV